MEYTRRYEVLRSIFNPDKKEISIPDSEIRIISTEFTSDYSSEEFLNRSDFSIMENLSFTYPVFIPADINSRKVILLLHGLNERSWIKYLAWAYSLADLTGSYVVLFPISFHINRSPDSWKDPRAMTVLLRERGTNPGDIRLSTFANIALSKRLTEDPKRFVNSGYQTVCDLENLMISIRDGKHPVIPGGCKVDLFAYSIGAFLAEIIMIANPQMLFSDSRLFMFCGGSVFSNMNGVSKLIMDSEAFDRVYSYYMKDFEKDIKIRNSFMDKIRSVKIGMAFRSMIDLSRFKKFREQALSELDNRIRSIGMAKDIVIPAHGILKTLRPSGSSRPNPVEVWDFDYPYSHENPFPVYNDPRSRLVDKYFDKLIANASRFFS